MNASLGCNKNLRKRPWTKSLLAFRSHSLFINGKKLPSFRPLINSIPISQSHIKKLNGTNVTSKYLTLEQSRYCYKYSNKEKTDIHRGR